MRLILNFFWFLFSFRFCTLLFYYTFYLFIDKKFLSLIFRRMIWFRSWSFLFLINFLNTTSLIFCSILSFVISLHLFLNWIVYTILVLFFQIWRDRASWSLSLILFDKTIHFGLVSFCFFFTLIYCRMIFLWSTILIWRIICHVWWILLFLFMWYRNCIFIDILINSFLNFSYFFHHELLKFINFVFNLKSVLICNFWYWNMLKIQIFFNLNKSIF